MAGRADLWAPGLRRRLVSGLPPPRAIACGERIQTAQNRLCSVPKSVTNSMRILAFEITSCVMGQIAGRGEDPAVRLHTAEVAGCFGFCNSLPNTAVLR